jgi:hypothetical protein
MRRTDNLGVIEAIPKLDLSSQLRNELNLSPYMSGDAFHGSRLTSGDTECKKASSLTNLAVRSTNLELASSLWGEL